MGVFINIKGINKISIIILLAGSRCVRCEVSHIPVLSCKLEYRLFFPWEIN